MREPPVVMCTWVISIDTKCMQLITYCVVDEPSFVRHRAQPFTVVIVQSKAERPLSPFAFLNVVFPLSFHNKLI